MKEVTSYKCDVDGKIYQTKEEVERIENEFIYQNTKHSIGDTVFFWDYICDKIHISTVMEIRVHDKKLQYIVKGFGNTLCEEELFYSMGLLLDHLTLYVVDDTK